jgi:hypothetical protein
MEENGVIDVNSTFRSAIYQTAVAMLHENTNPPDPVNMVLEKIHALFEINLDEFTNRVGRIGNQLRSISRQILQSWWIQSYHQTPICCPGWLTTQFWPPVPKFASYPRGPIKPKIRVFVWTYLRQTWGRHIQGIAWSLLNIHLTQLLDRTRGFPLRELFAMQKPVSSTRLDSSLRYSETLQ